MICKEKTWNGLMGSASYVSQQRSERRGNIQGTYQLNKLVDVVVTLIGAPGVGKSSTGFFFSTSCIPTFIRDVNSYTHQIKLENRLIRMKIHDTRSKFYDFSDIQAKFGGTDVFVGMYNRNDKNGESAKILKQYLRLVKHFCGADVPIHIVGVRDAPDKQVDATAKTILGEEYPYSYIAGFSNVKNCRKTMDSVFSKTAQMVVSDKPVDGGKGMMGLLKKFGKK
jgi:hypothetical protein